MGFGACLIDVYETALTCDFSAHRSELPVLAGVDAEAWDASFAAVFEELGPAVTDGRVSMTDVWTEVIRRSGSEPSEAQLTKLVRRDGELLIETADLYADVVPFLETLRGRGVASALVSNCAENTRALLDDLGLLELVDAAVLSCEVGSAKPDPPIYRQALDRLGVPAGEAVFVDDQVAYCRGAEALGMHAVRISRSGGDGHGPGTIASLAELEALF